MVLWKTGTYWPYYEVSHAYTLVIQEAYSTKHWNHSTKQYLKTVICGDSKFNMTLFTFQDTCSRRDKWFIYNFTFTPFLHLQHSNIAVTKHVPYIQDYYVKSSHISLFNIHYCRPTLSAWWVTKTSVKPQLVNKNITSNINCIIQPYLTADRNWTTGCITTNKIFSSADHMFHSSNLQASQLKTYTFTADRI